MKKLLITVALATLPATLATVGFSGIAAAHPTELMFETRGECERALAAENVRDLTFLEPYFETRGDIMKHLHANFQCEYDPVDDTWHMVDLRGTNS